MTKPRANESSEWPVRQILWLGYFGPNTPEGTRFRNRSVLALALFIGGMLFSAWMREHVWIQFVWAVVPGLTFGYIAWEWWRYISHLDELARRLQVEAAAWTYGVGLAIAMAFGGIFSVLHWNFNPILMMIVLEPIRAWRLWVLARRF